MSNWSASCGRRVIVADRFPVSRIATGTALREAGLADVIIPVADLHQGLDVIEREKFDYAVADTDLAGVGDGIRLCRAIKQLPDTPPVLAFSSTNDHATLADWLASGGDSFVYRTAEVQILTEAVGAMLNSRTVWFLGTRHDPEELADGASQLAVRCGGMTKREQEILALMLRRYSNDEIAQHLYIARQTAKNYVSNVLQKLGVGSRRELLSKVIVHTS